MKSRDSLDGDCTNLARFQRIKPSNLALQVSSSFYSLSATVPLCKTLPTSIDYTLMFLDCTPLYHGYIESSCSFNGMYSLSEADLAAKGFRREDTCAKLLHSRGRCMSYFFISHKAGGRFEFSRLFLESSHVSFPSLLERRGHPCHQTPRRRHSTLGQAWVAKSFVNLSPPRAFFNDDTCAQRLHALAVAQVLANHTEIFSNPFFSFCHWFLAGAGRRIAARS